MSQKRSTRYPATRKRSTTRRTRSRKPSSRLPRAIGKTLKGLGIALVALTIIGFLLPEDNKDATVEPTPTATEEVMVLTRSMPNEEPAPIELVFETTAAPTATAWALRRGDQSDTVKSLQKRLIALGYLSGSADGAYGENTETAVKAFQRAAGLNQTGICDVETATRMKAGDAPKTAKPTKSSEKTVYITPTGKKYHTKNCQHLRKNVTAVKISEAKRRGLTACSDCNPG